MYIMLTQLWVYLPQKLISLRPYSVNKYENNKIYAENYLASNIIATPIFNH